MIWIFFFAPLAAMNYYLMTETRKIFHSNQRIKYSDLMEFFILNYVR